MSQLRNIMMSKGALEPPHTLLTSCYFNNAYVDTGIIIQNSLTRMELKYSYTRSSAGFWCWGCRTNNSTARFTGQDSNSGVSVTILGTSKAVATADKTTAMECVYDGSSFSITNEGVTETQTFGTWVAGTYPFYFGRMNNGGNATASGMQGYFWYLRFWDSGNLIGEFLPAKDGSNVVCIYDTVSRTLIYGQGGTISETA